MTPRPDNSPLRVILVGRSPIEQRLRRDSGIDLIRARAALDAVGELGISDADADLTPVVLLAPGVVADVELRDLLSALRRVDQRVRVLRVRSEQDNPAEFHPSDPPNSCAWIAADAEPGDLRAILAASPAPIPAAAPQTVGLVARIEAPERIAPQPRPAAPFPSGSASFSAGESAPPADMAEGLLTDEAILAALLTGSDILGPCLDQLRRRFRPQEIRFQWAAASDQVLGVNDPVIQAFEGGERVAIEHRGRLFAWLEGPASRQGELVRSARWLAHWLAVREQHAQLRSAAFTDPLTGAWNRRYLDRFLPMAIDRARQKRHDVSLLLFDIDNFKHYNDTFGHPAGDDILVETVRLLNSVIRPTDRVTRIGGDEFAVVFDNPDGPRDPTSHHPASIFEIARRFQRQITEHRFPKLGRSACGCLTVSGGLATYPWDAADARTLIEQADRLILDSKRAGKNVICIGPGAQQAMGGCGGASPPDSHPDEAGPGAR